MKQNWFYRRSSIRKLWTGAPIVLGLTVLLELFLNLHPHFKIESVFGFYALYGFFACVATVLIAKLLGFLIKRRDDYYDG